MNKKAKSLFSTPGGYLGTKDYISFGLAGLGQNFIYGLMANYLLIFYTDVFLIPSQTVGTMFLVAKLWDAINDPMMGSIVDKTRTKWGKMRPYLAFVPIPMAISTILIFTAPNFSMTGKIVYMYITYIAWGMIYTVSDVPYWSLSAAMTPHPQERANIISFTRVITTLGMALPLVLVPAVMLLKDKNLLPQSISNSRSIYFLIAVFMAVTGAGLFSLSFFGTRERVAQNEKAPTFKESMAFLFKNKPLMLLVASILLAFPRGISGIAANYVATYMLGGLHMVLLLGIPTAIGGAISMALTPWMIKKFGAWKSFFFANSYAIVLPVLQYLVGYSNLPALLAMNFICSLSSGLLLTIQPVMITDCVDYTEWKTGQRAEGVAFSMQTFQAKACSALQGWVGTLILAGIGYVAPKANEAGELINQIQSASTMKGLWAMQTIIPALASVLCLIPLFFYELKGQRLERIRADLKLRHEQAARANDAENAENVC